MVLGRRPPGKNLVCAGICIDLRPSVVAVATGTRSRSRSAQCAVDAGGGACLAARKVIVISSSAAWRMRNTLQSNTKTHVLRPLPPARPCITATCLASTSLLANRLIQRVQAYGCKSLSALAPRHVSVIDWQRGHRLVHPTYASAHAAADVQPCQTSCRTRGENRGSPWRRRWWVACGMMGWWDRWMGGWWDGGMVGWVDAKVRWVLADWSGIEWVVTRS
jgi:hypothetical protein